MGFSEYKKRTYNVLLKLENATVGQISKKAKIPSSKIYEVLSWLYENGYISIVNQKPLVYAINNPRAVLKSEIRTRIDRLKDMEIEINKLKTGDEFSGSADFQIVYGRNSFFKRVKDAVTRSEQTIFAVVKSWRLDYELKELTKDFIIRGGEVKFLGPINKENRAQVSEWKKIGVQIKHYIPESTRFTIWDGKLMTLGLKDEGSKDYFSLWMENEYLGRILAEYFDKLWKEIK